MNSAWTKRNINEHQLATSKRVLEALREIVEERLKAFEAIELTQETYDSPSWAYKQAHFNGAKTMLRFIDQLIKE